MGLTGLSDAGLMLTMGVVFALGLAVGWALKRTDPAARPVRPEHPAHPLSGPETPEQSLARLRARPSGSVTVQELPGGGILRLPNGLTWVDPRIMVDERK